VSGAATAVVRLLRGALSLLRTGRRRTVLAAVGVLVAGAMAGAALTVSIGLGGGFDRAAERADLPDIVARFDGQDPARIRERIEALPNVEDYAPRTEISNQRIRAGDHETGKGALQLVDTDARRGYAIVAGRDLRRGSLDSSDALVEQGLARSWGLHVGDTIDVGRLGEVRIVGISLAPDNVAFPLASAPRVLVSGPALEARFRGRLRVDQALVWTHDRSRTDVTLQQARATTYGVGNLRFVTRTGVRLIIDQAAGVVVALLVAFSLVALIAATTMLASQSASEVARRLPVIGVQRAIGVPRGTVAGEQALAAGLVGLLAGGVGVLVGALVVAGPSSDLLAALNETPPGGALVLPLVGLTLLLGAIAAAAAGWPAWRAAGRPPVALLRGGTLVEGGLRARWRARRELRAERRPTAGRTGFLGLGAKLVLARPGRAGATVAVLGVSGGVILLMLGLASLLVALRDDPSAVGTRYALTVQAPDGGVDAVRRVAGVADAGERYEVRGADSFALGEPVKITAFDGRLDRFVNPPLADGRRVRGPGEVEIGTGLATALGLGTGGTLAVQLQNGGEARFRVVGTVRALQDDGRVAFARPDRLLDADPGLRPDIAVRLRDGADVTAVGRRLASIGATPTKVGGATTSDKAFLDTLATVLKAVAALDGLVCLYALVQALALTARERRPTLALLRAQGAATPTVVRVLLGAGLVLALPGALVAFLLQRLVLSPLVSQLAAGYADLGTAASTAAVAGVTGGFVVFAALAGGWVARRVVAEPPVLGLREG
jgi:predicted lysophospholipase L1 biosynthesis ABC-type transport system permease subunit